MQLKYPLMGMTIVLMALYAPLALADNSPDAAKPMQEQGGGHHGQKDDMMAKVLNLSEDQVKQLQDLHQKERDTMKSTFEQLKAAHQAFEAEISKASPDMTKVDAAQAQIKTITGQMADNRLNSLLEVKKVLTPEQFSGYLALKKERELKMMHHHKGGQFGHHGGWGKDRDGQKGPGKDMPASDEAGE